MSVESKEQIATLLSWDSDFFGFQVASLLPRQIGIDVLTSTLDRLWRDGVKLVYWPSDPTDPVSHMAATFCGGVLVDRKCLYTRNIPTGLYSKTRISGIEKLSETSELNEDLCKLALQCGIFSRFNVDPNFPKEGWEALYREWMKNSINCTFADAVLVKQELDCIFGVITLSVHGGLGKIGLLGVNEKSRGQGIGRKLIFAALDWFKNRGVSRVEVLTQGDNLAACRLYESCGFVLDKTDDFYHFWNPME